MAVMHPKLKDSAIALGSDSGSDLDFAKLPVSYGGKPLYARRLVCWVTGTVTTTASGTIADGELLKLVQKFQLKVADVGTIVDLTGVDVHRLFRFRHGHIATTGATAIGASGSTVTKRWQYVIDLVHPLDLKRNNGAIPIATLKRAEFKAWYNAAAVISTGLSTLSTDAKMQVFVECVTLDGKRVPSLYIQDYESPAASQEATYQEGWYIDALLCPGNDAAWPAPAGDFQQINAEFGQYTLWGPQTDQRVLVEHWNARIHDQASPTAGIGRLLPPVDTQGDFHTFIPLRQIPAMEQGEGSHFFSSENLGTRAKPLLRFNAVPTTQPKIVRTRLFDHGTWSEVIKRDLGIPSDVKLKTQLAGGKGTLGQAMKAPLEE